MTRKSDFFGLLIILAVATLLYIINIDGWYMQGDEGTDLYEAWQLQQGKVPGTDYVAEQQPLYLMAGASLIGLFGRQVLALRLLSAVQISYGIGFALAFRPARINQVKTQNGVYERVIAELGDYEFDEIAVAGSRWELRGYVFAQLNGKDYEFVDIRNVARDDLDPGTVVIYDPSFFTPAGERQLNPEDYPALTELPDNPPDSWQLLFTDEQIELFGGQPVYVYQIASQ